MVHQQVTFKESWNDLQTFKSILSQSFFRFLLFRHTSLRFLKFQIVFPHSGIFLTFCSYTHSFGYYRVQTLVPDTWDVVVSVELSVEGTGRPLGHGVGALVKTGDR